MCNICRKKSRVLTICCYPIFSEIKSSFRKLHKEKLVSKRDVLRKYCRNFWYSIQSCELTKSLKNSLQVISGYFGIKLPHYLQVSNKSKLVPPWGIFFKYAGYWWNILTHAMLQDVFKLPICCQIAMKCTILLNPTGHRWKRLCNGNNVARKDFDLAESFWDLEIFF